MSNRMTIDLMARVLAKSDIALSDATACAVRLIEHRFTSREIRDHLENAIYMARVKRGNASMGGFIRMVAQTGRRA